jgi:hypothetical protein
MKLYAMLLLFLSTHQVIHACPITIVNDDSEKHDIIIADHTTATIIRYGKTGSIGKSNLPTTFFIYTARKTSDTEQFTATLGIKEKNCPIVTTTKKSKKKKETLKLCELQARSKTDSVRQSNDSERFIVEPIAKNKGGL